MNNSGQLFRNSSADSRTTPFIGQLLYQYFCSYETEDFYPNLEVRRTFLIA